MERGIGSYHPIVSFIYFAVVIITSMLYMHPVFVIISVISAVTYNFLLNKDGTKKILLFGLTMATFIALGNLLFVNKGVTVLFYLRGNGVTLESLFYGIISGLMMLSVIVWFSCYNEVITSDKFLYVFGKIVPSIALVISMTLRLIPKLITQIKIISKSQKTIGLDYSEGTLLMRAKSSMRILSILVSWALEDAIQTADSMKARGYGLKGRTSFSIYKFIDRDAVMLFFITVISMILIMGYTYGYGELMFYPYIEQIEVNIGSLLIYGAFTIIAFLPVILEVMEAVKWKYLK